VELVRRASAETEPGGGDRDAVGDHVSTITASRFWRVESVEIAEEEGWLSPRPPWPAPLSRDEAADQHLVVARDRAGKTRRLLASATGASVVARPMRWRWQLGWCPPHPPEGMDGGGEALAYQRLRHRVL